MLLSSSVRLRRTDIKFRSRLGSPDAVISLGTLSYMLSMIPEVQLGAGTLRRTLFNFGETAHLGDTEKLALRIIRGVDGLNMPWARRRTLKNELETALHNEARRRGMTVQAARTEIVNVKQVERTVAVIKEAINASSPTNVHFEELHDARSKVKSLEASVQAMRTQIEQLHKRKKKRK